MYQTGIMNVKVLPECLGTSLSAFTFGKTQISVAYNDSEEMGIC